MPTLAEFETGAIDPASFHHREHVRMGYEMLRRYSFPQAVDRFSRALQSISARAGHPEIYHETITVAFLAAISERMIPASSWDEFARHNPALMEKGYLERWYPAEVLRSKAAAAKFRLPAPPRSMRWFGFVFAACLTLSSLLTMFVPESDHHGTALLATAEIFGALFLLLRQLRWFGLALLLIIFALAATLEWQSGRWPVRFVLYAAAALLIARQR